MVSSCNICNIYSNADGTHWSAIEHHRGSKLPGFSFWKPATIQHALTCMVSKTGYGTSHMCRDIAISSPHQQDEDIYS